MRPAVRALRLVAATATLQSLSGAAIAGALHGWRAAVTDLSRRDDPAAHVQASVETVAWAGVAVCCLWFAAAVLACARDLARHPGRPLPRAVEGALRPPLVRSLLVLLVGGCLTAPTPQPVSDEGWAVLDGLPVPGLPLGVGPRRDPPPHPLVVRPGDSLWSLTAGLLGPRAADAAVARAWPALHRANRVLIGPDPDLIRPGVALRVPAGLTARHDQHPAGAPR